MSNSAQCQGGVYYDRDNSRFVRVKEPQGGEAVAAEVITPLEPGVEPVPLTAEEWEDLQDDLLPVPGKAVEDPVAYYEHVVETLRRDDHQYDVGFMYADKMTEVAALQTE
ncbi:hypothetical protein [Haloarcula sp. Atlit-7R]|uniref:hypothetical protein n=1 Tax=Haloarcula sp. Atlit-7R TaxID=2282125 RepID=UPI000EF149C9|nr:hypothetical protein [Haloarcula sp. Atlit-7R]RLM94396.1 hypothetical protein D3D01_16160 [Haloarcula sp. Atlit-7R]